MEKDENIYLSNLKRANMSISAPTPVMRYGHQGVGEPLKYKKNRCESLNNQILDALDGTDAEYAKKGRTNYSRRHESYYER